MRLFSYTGVQRDLWCLDGPIVTMVGSGKFLAVVYHRDAPIRHTEGNWASKNGTQRLNVLLMSVTDKKTLYEGPVSLAPGSTLTWIGFSESNLLLIMDSSGVIKGLREHWGFRWTPLLDTNITDYKKSSRFYPF